MSPSLSLAFLLLGFTPAIAQSPGALVLESADVRYSVSVEGRNLGWVDRASGIDYLKATPPTACASVRRGGQEFPATAAAIEDGRLTLRFGGAGVEAEVKVEARPAYLRFTVEAVRGPEIDALVFVQVPLTLRGRPEEPFGACALSLNLSTRVDQLPALQTEWRAACHRKFGLVGAQVALVGRPMHALLPALKAVLAENDALPRCTVAGPWADEVPFNHGSYLFNFGALTETNVQEWIDMTRSLGFTQIDHHGGGAGFFRFGDFELDRTKWPEGWATFRRTVARLHAAGIGSIFHTYAFFIDKRSKYVTPVPDPRLDAFRTFTLAGPIDATATELTVNEPTAGLSMVTGFFEHNSVVLHVGDELIAFGGVSAAAPWRFTGLQRGALGTRASAHAAGARARQLKECFGLFVPDPESSLFEEIAANHAEVVNRAGFDGLYLDAIDGSSILRGGEECWYWADKFVVEIQKRLQRPVGMEMSAMWHHFWQYRTRWQAWDYPQRGHRRFVDLHAEAVHGGLRLPLHLGWWNFQSFNPPQIEPTYPEVMEHLGARLIGWDAGISLTGGVDRERLRTVPLFRRAVDLLRTCEDLRHAGAFDETVKAQLRAPGRSFALRTDATGKPRFHPAAALPHTVAFAEPWTCAWSATNGFPAQPLRFRLEALMSAAAYDDPRAIVLADFAGAASAEWTPSAAAGVTAAFAPPAGQESLSALVVATNAGQGPRAGAWARWQRPFSPTRNLKEHQALGVALEGDASGALLAVRLESPKHLAFGAVADRYLPVDFTGRRVVTLLETESERWSDYTWNDGKGLYNLYRETIDFGAVESVTVWLQNLPAGREVRGRLGPIKALPMRSATLKDPVIVVNGQTVVFPVELSSGGWLECEGAGAGACVHYGPKGERLAEVTPRGAWPVLRAGENRVEVSGTAAPSGPAPRLKLTLFSHGDALQ